MCARLPPKCVVSCEACSITAKGRIHKQVQGEVEGHGVAWQISTLTERWTGSPKVGSSGSTTCLGYSLDGHVDSLNRAQLALFDYPAFFPCFSSAVRPMPQYNSQRQARSALSPRKAAKFHSDWSNVNFKHDHSGFESQKAFQPQSRPRITPIASCATVFNLPTSGSSKARENLWRKCNLSYSWRCLLLGPAMR